MKRIGFLSFGHWSDSYGSQVRTAADSLVQSLEFAVAAEELGADGAYFRVHHFARQLGSPFPLLAAIGARTHTIEIGTAVIDMRYENPMYMAEDAGAADVISGGRLQLGISRGSPEQVIAAGGTSATSPPTARATPTWRGAMPTCSSRRDQDQIGFIDTNTRAIFGRSYAAEPDVLVKELAADEAIEVADTLLLTVLLDPRARRSSGIFRHRRF